MVAMVPTWSKPSISMPSWSRSVNPSGPCIECICLGFHPAFGCREQRLRNRFVIDEIDETEAPATRLPHLVRPMIDHRADTADRLVAVERHEALRFAEFECRVLLRVERRQLIHVQRRNRIRRIAVQVDPELDESLHVLFAGDRTNSDCHSAAFRQLKGRTKRKGDADPNDYRTLGVAFELLAIQCVARKAGHFDPFATTAEISGPRIHAGGIPAKEDLRQAPPEASRTASHGSDSQCSFSPVGKGFHQPSFVVQ